MATETSPAADTAGTEDFDVTARKGWQFFTKFLLANVVTTVAALIFIAIITVWS